VVKGIMLQVGSTEPSSFGTSFLILLITFLFKIDEAVRTPPNAAPNTPQLTISCPVK